MNSNISSKVISLTNNSWWMPRKYFNLLRNLKEFEKENPPQKIRKRKKGEKIKRMEQIERKEKEILKNVYGMGKKKQKKWLVCDLFWRTLIDSIIQWLSILIYSRGWKSWQVTFAATRTWSHPPTWWFWTTSSSSLPRQKYSTSSG